MSPSCRFVSTTEPRVISGRHQDPCACDGEIGCLRCTALHCCICQRSHVDRNTCPACLDAARSDLQAIGDLCLGLPEEAAQKGVQSEAMVLLGPVADPQAWQHRFLAASFFHRFDESYVDDCRDELHPLWILGTWEQVWRDHLDHYSEARITVASSVAYLDMQIGYMSEQIDPPFDEFARDLRAGRGHLEDVLREGIREERGAPCVQCERPMVRTEDHWECRKCHRRVTEAEYRFAVGAAYRAHSDRLTAVELGEKLSMKASMIRVWGSRGLVRKRGKDHNGITLYDVSDATARLELGVEAG